MHIFLDSCGFLRVLLDSLDFFGILTDSLKSCRNLAGFSFFSDSLILSCSSEFFPIIFVSFRILTDLYFFRLSRIHSNSVGIKIIFSNSRGCCNYIFGFIKIFEDFFRFFWILWHSVGFFLDSSWSTQFLSALSYSLVFVRILSDFLKICNILLDSYSLDFLWILSISLDFFPDSSGSSPVFSEFCRILYILSSFSLGFFHILLDSYGSFQILSYLLEI